VPLEDGEIIWSEPVGRGVDRMSTAPH
jgi:hypothetical protein